MSHQTEATTPRLRRVIVAGLLAPVVGIAVLVALLIATLYIAEPDTGSSLGTLYLHNLFFFTFFGLPGALFLEVCVGVPAFHLLRRSGRLTRGHVAAVSAITGALAGAVGFGILASGATLDLPLLTLFSCLGALGGVVAGFVFWAGVWGNNTA